MYFIWRGKKLSRYSILVIAFTAMLVFLSACGGSSEENETNEVTIGYFPNLTHIATIVGLENGYFEEEFGEDITLKTKTVTNGGLFMEAMATETIDVGTVGPGPLLNIYVKDPSYHIISGAVNGGAVLVADNDSGVTELADLDGKRVAIPVIGSTQDVMLRKALQEVDLSPTTSGGTVELYAAAPADTTTLFHRIPYTLQQHRNHGGMCWKHKRMDKNCLTGMNSHGGKNLRIQ